MLKNERRCFLLFIHLKGSGDAVRNRPVAGSLAEFVFRCQRKVTDMVFSWGDWCWLSEGAISGWVLTSNRVPSLSACSFLFLTANEKPVFDMSLSLTYIAKDYMKTVCVCMCGRVTRELTSGREERLNKRTRTWGGGGEDEST